MVSLKKDIALLHRHPPEKIKETNAAFTYLKDKVAVLTFKRFNRLNSWKCFLKSLLWIFYAPLLTVGKNYRVIYLDDSFPFYPIFVKILNPRSKVILRIGDFHLMYYFKGIPYKILHAIEKIGWRKADLILAISNIMAEKIRSEVSTDVIVVNDPVDEEDFPYVKRSTKNVVMFHGTLTRNKNIDILLEAAKRLKQLTFWIVGDGPDRRRLERIAPHNVIFKGWIPHTLIWQYISMCRIGVALRSNNPGNDYVVTSPFIQYGIMGKICLVSQRKVFQSYEWTFNDVESLVALIKKAVNEEIDTKYLREKTLQNHSAKTIGEIIWKILTQR